MILKWLLKIDLAGEKNLLFVHFFFDSSLFLLEEKHSDTFQSRSGKKMFFKTPSRIQMSKEGNGQTLGTLVSASDSSSEMSDALLVDGFFLFRFFLTLFFSS